MRELENLDTLLLLLINGSHTPFGDSFNLFVTNKYYWIPLYILLGFIFIKKLGLKNGLLVIGGALLCFAFTDLISARIIKPWVARPRPCHTSLAIELWLPQNKCGGAYGFVSNHAANTMGIAIFCIQVFTKKIKGKLAGVFVFVLLAYAFLNSYSRVYLGVHYPTDVICGMLLGIIVGSGIYFVWNRWVWKEKKSN